VCDGATTFPAIEPSPKVHARDTMPWSSLDVPLSKEQDSPAQIAVTLAVGGRSGVVTVIVSFAVALCPDPSVTVSVTTYVPALA
jgi:hypothetical protein